jgi:hypothetical protein
MQVFLAYQNIEVLMTQVIDAIFGQDLTFDVQPSAAGTTLTQALSIRQILQDQFNRLNCGGENFISLREIYRRMKKEAFIYGNGVCEFGWESSLKTKNVYSRGDVQQYGQAVHDGQVIQVPIAQQSGVSMEPTPIPVNKPFLVQRSIKDFYIDPNCPSANIQEARFSAFRTLVPISELQSYRGREGFNIPDDKRLFELSKKKFVTSGDESKAYADQASGINNPPILDNTIDPRLARVELIRYWQKDKHVWMLGREDVALNRDNPLGVLPQLGVTYTDVPNRFYSISICDLTEGDQNLAIELLNNRLDELNLIMHPPIIRKRGSFLANSAAKFRPGGSFELDNPKEDLVRMEMGNVTAQAFMEVEQVDRRTQKTIGVNDTTGFGVSAAGGNSALRSATGVQTQANAQSSRVHYQVANDEDQFMLPLLNIFWGMTRAHMNPNMLIQLTGQDTPIDPVDVLNADVRFSMETASKMKGRAALQSGGINQFVQGLLNPSVLELASEQQNLVPDFMAIAQLFCDTYNQKAQTFYKPMSPQEQQARQQKMMAPLQAKQQLQDSRLQAMSQDSHDRDETNLIIAVIENLAKTGALNELLGVKRDTEIAAQRKLEGGR